MILTSPPYDDLRDYNGTLEWNFDIFKEISYQLYRVLKNGGVLVWVVNRR
jgi:site-specific DNA-methyltransferase (adenine-specific)